MDYKLIKGNSSNYEIVLNMTEDDLKSCKNQVILNFQKDMNIQGFRKGHVPLNLVEQNIQPEYLKIGIYEEAIHKGLDKVLKENESIKFIGNIYDLHQEEKGGKTIITFKLDIYPDVTVKNKNYETVKIKEIDNSAKKDEIDNAINNLKRQYAEYKDAEKVTKNTVIKVKFDITDKSGTKLDSGSAFFGKEDFDEHEILIKTFEGSKLSEKITIKYDHKKLPHILHFHKEEGKPESINFEIMDIKDVVLPELNDETIIKLFGGEVKNLTDLTDKIKEIIEKQKYDQGLLDMTETIINEVKTSLEVSIPKTLIDQETASRHESLKQRFGGDAGLNKYIHNMGEDKAKEMFAEIESAAKESLQKYFILRKYVELLEINDIDWNKPMDVEQKIYSKLIGGKTEGKSTKATEKASETAKPKAKTTKKTK